MTDWHEPQVIEATNLVRREMHVHDRLETGMWRNGAGSFWAAKDLSDVRVIVDSDGQVAPPKCGARHPDNTSIIPCMLPEHDERAPHWSTSGCAGGGVQWLDDPEPRRHWPSMLSQVVPPPITDEKPQCVCACDDCDRGHGRRAVPIPITDEMVERSAVAWHNELVSDAPDTPLWPDLPPDDRAVARRRARAALNAALSGEPR